MTRVGTDEFFPGFLSASLWLWPLQEAGSALSTHAAFPGREELSRLYAERVRAPELSLSFVAEPPTQGRRSAGRTAAARYDGAIALRRQVPTREGSWHDLLNALCFMTFPRAKRALHVRQYQLLRAREPAPGQPWPGARTREQDALTLLDEGGALVATNDADLYAALREQGSPEAAQACLRACAEGRARIVPFGHALMEHQVKWQVSPGGCARALLVDAPLRDDPVLLEAVDRALATLLSDPSELREPRAQAFRLVLPATPPGTGP